MPRPLRRSAGLNVLVLGYSSLARRRILPALARLGVTRVDIASRTRQPAWPDGVAGRAFGDYDEALAASDAPLAYISTRNHEHAAWAAAALDSGRDVVVDKPAALSVRDVAGLVDRAARAGRLVAEATTWLWHPQVARLLELAASAGPVTRITATFSFPPLPADDVRHRAAWGGGALWDLGPYAMTPGRAFFDALPDACVTRAVTAPGDEVETSFGVLARYPGDRLLVGHFGSTTAYVNRLEVAGPRLALRLERAFTTAPDQPCRLTGEHAGARIDEEIPAADAFAEFLRDVMTAAGTGGAARFADLLVRDAEALDRLRAGLDR